MFKSKTFWFNILAFITILATNFGYTGELPPELMALAVAVVALVNAIIDLFKRN